MAFFLILLSGRQSLTTLPSNLAQLWNWGLSSSVGFWFSGRQPDSVRTRLEQIYFPRHRAFQAELKNAIEQMERSLR